MVSGDERALSANAAAPAMPQGKNLSCHSCQGHRSADPYPSAETGRTATGPHRLALYRCVPPAPNRQVGLTIRSKCGN